MLDVHWWVEKMATITAGLMMSYYCRGYHGHALYAAVRMPIDLGGGNLCAAEFLIQGVCKEGSFACVSNLIWKLQCLGLSETWAWYSTCSCHFALSFPREPKKKSKLRQMWQVGHAWRQKDEHTSLFTFSERVREAGLLVSDDIKRLILENPHHSLLRE